MIIPLLMFKAILLSCGKEDKLQVIRLDFVIKLAFSDLLLLGIVHFKWTHENV